MSIDTDRSLAVLGGPPAFPAGLPFCRPLRPPLERVVARVQPSYDLGMLTNGRLVAELEETVALELGVSHVVATSSCTAGLMLAVQALVDGRSGPVVEPSFTFAASAHGAAWNGRELRFVEVDPETFHVDVAAMEAALDGASLVVATHIFGAPCAPAVVEAMGRAADVPVLFDAAHAFGASSDGRMIGGFGDAEVFSLTPTKVLVAGEGGLIATDDAALAQRFRVGRDYGNPGNYDTQFVGLNARMSEFHAAMALESLAIFGAASNRRREIARRYRDALARIPGVRCQAIRAGDISAFKDLTIAVDVDQMGLTRDDLVQVLACEGIDTRNYFEPPVHQQAAYRHQAPVELPVTDQLSASIVSLPIYPDLDDQQVDRIIEIIGTAQELAEPLVEVLAATGRRGPLRPWRPVDPSDRPIATAQQEPR